MIAQFLLERRMELEAANAKLKESVKASLKDENLDGKGYIFTLPKFET